MATEGTVTVVGPGNSERIFQPDSRPGRPYLSQPGDYGTLTALGGGAFSLREESGLLRVFRSDGKLDYVEDATVNRITCTYTAGFLSRLEHSGGQSLDIAYNAADRIQSLTDSDGRQTVYTYDLAGEHLLSVGYFDGRTAIYEYSTGGAPATEHAITRITQPDKSRQVFTYDSHGRLIKGGLCCGFGEDITYTYDSVGGIYATNAFGGTTAYSLPTRGVALAESAIHWAMPLVTPRRRRC